MTKFIKAEQGLHHSVIYTNDERRYFRYSKGTWTWRNNNPGNLVPGDISKRNNQIGVAGGFAVFPDYETGHNALLDCLHTTYGDKSIDQLIDGYAPPEDNPNNPKYKKFVHKETSIIGNTKIKNFTSEQFRCLWQAIEKFEGWKEGDITEVYKISCVHRNKKGIVFEYCVDTIGWITKEECICLAKKKKIDAEICVSSLGKNYLRTSGFSSFQDKFSSLIEKIS